MFIELPASTKTSVIIKVKRGKIETLAPRHRRGNYYMCHVFSPHEVLVPLHFQEESEDGRKANQKVFFFFFFLNPSSAEAPFLLNQNLCFFHTGSAITWNPITDHVTASIKFPIIMSQRHSNIRKSSNTAASVGLCEYVHVCVCMWRASVCWKRAEKLRQTIHSSECFMPFLATLVNQHSSLKIRRHSK